MSLNYEKIICPFILPTFIIIILFLFSTKFFSQITPPPGHGEEPLALGIDYYMIPMIVVALWFAFYTIKKKSQV
jgi:hypothetical protein